MIRPVRQDGTIDTGGLFEPIVRRRVLERIASAARQRVVLMIAPAGYGKSVALRQYLDGVGERALLFDVLPEHRGLLPFLRGFADALAEVAPDARATLPGAYERNAASSSPGSDLALWMHSHLKSFRGTIAIDDLHVAQDDREVTRFVASLIERTKGGVQWILASRSTTGLPIGTWLAYGESDLAIDEHDLKFSIDETRETARAFRLTVRDEELYELLNVTDGWATALSFAMRSSTRSIDIRNISSLTRDMIYRYLAEQVYESLDDEERRFLETASLLPDVRVERLIAAGFDRAASVLEALRGRVAFITEIDAGRYRLQDLFRDFALRQLELRGQTVARERRVAFARVLAATDDDASALRLFIEAGALDEARALLASRGIGLVTHGYVDEVEAAIDACGESLDERPVMLALRGLVATGRGRYADAERLLQRAIRDIGDEPAGADLTLRLALLVANRGESVRTLLEPLLGAQGLAVAQQVEARALLAADLARGDDGAAARELIRATEASLPAVDDEEALARILQRLGFAHLQLRDLASAATYLNQCIEIALRRNMWSLLARAYALLAQIAMLNDASPTQALWNAQQGAQAASRAGDHQDLQTSLLTILSIETRRGNGERAQQIERQLGELGNADPRRNHYIASAQAHRHAWAGGFADAHRLFGSVLDRQPHAVDRALVHAFYTLTLALDGHVKQSAVAAQRTLELIKAQDAERGYGKILLESARLFIAAGEIVAGRLSGAARMIARKSSDHELVECLRELCEELLRAARNSAYAPDAFDPRIEALRNHGWGGYARYVDLVRERIELHHAAADKGDAELTPSELKILRALAAGLAPKEIAAEMDRSLYTIQTHIQNLMEKLGSHGRNDAIAAAKRRGIL